MQSVFDAMAAVDSEDTYVKKEKEPEDENMDGSTALDVPRPITTPARATAQDAGPNEVHPSLSEKAADDGQQDALAKPEKVPMSRYTRSEPTRQDR